MKAVQDVPPPINPIELKSFPIMFNFYGKFIPNLSSILESAHSFLRKKISFRSGRWNSKKHLIKPKTSSNLSDVLVHYDPEKELVVCCDA